MMVNVQLINAPIDREYNNAFYENGCYPPLGVLWVANHLCNQGFDVEVIDGQHNSLDSILERINAPYVGVSFNIRSTHSLDKILEESKKRGAITIVGGQAATVIYRRLLQLNPNIDYVVRYDGEHTANLIQRLEEDSSVNGVPNIVYQKGGKIIENPINLIDLSELSVLNPLSFGFDWEDYFKYFQEAMKKHGVDTSHSRPITLFTQKGCPRRSEESGCSFCSRIDKKMRYKNPEKVAEEISILNDTYSPDFGEEFSDNFLFNISWLERLVDACRKRGIPPNLHWRGYADTRDLTGERGNKRLELAKQLGFANFVLGIESGDEEILRLNGKPNTQEQMLNAIKNMVNYNIGASPSYVLGLIGETEKTARQTVDFSKELNERIPVQTNFWNIMTPFPGSPAWSLMMGNRQIRSKYEGTYHFNCDELQRIFISCFTGLGESGYNFLQDLREKAIASIIKSEKDY